MASTIPQGPTEKHPLDVLKTRLVQRARRRNIACGLIIGAIVVVVWMCLTRIKSADPDAVQATNDLGGLLSQLKLLQIRMTNATTELALMDARRGDMVVILHEGEEELARILRENPNATTQETHDARERIVEMQSKIQTRDQEIVARRAVLDALEASEADIQKKIETSALHTSSVPIIFSLGTKIAGTVILLFGVQMLLAAFRYNTNLAVFYRARADEAELLADASKNRIHDWAATLHPREIDYGSVKAPVESVSEAVRKPDQIP